MRSGTMMVWAAWSLWALAGCFLGSSRGGAAEEAKPNFVVIFVDDLNCYLGSFGHPNAITPHMDRLAGEGVLFTNAHCQAPICGPSRASIMTGLRPSTTGIYGQIDDEDIREASEVTRYVTFLPEYLRQHGYHTMGVGKLFHHHAPAGVFEESGGREGGFGPKPEDGSHFKWKKKGTSTDWGAYPEEDEDMPDQRTAEWAIERLGRSYDRPFFLGVGFLRPHVPWYVPPHWFDRYNVNEVVTPPYRADDFSDMPEIASRIDELPMMPTTEWAIQNGEWQNILEAYLACVTFVDHQVGRVLEALAASPHAENTIVVLLSDHGYRLGEKGTFAKNCLWEEGTRVPFIFKGPGIQRGLVRDDAVELLDLYPTMLDLAALPANRLNEGESLKALLEGGSMAGEGTAITSYGRNNHAVASRNYRYIRYEDGTEELYDLWKDPHSFENIAGDPVYGGVKRRLAWQLPARNRLWSPASENNWPQILVEQRLAQMALYDFSVEESLDYCVHKSRELLARLPGPTVTPVSIEHGMDFWELRPIEQWGWTHGFWPGILWYSYEESTDPRLRGEAEAFTKALEVTLQRAAKSHDLGFIFNCSYGNAYRLTGDEYYARVLLQAADRLLEFYDPDVGTLLSWPAKVKNGEYEPHNTIIDSLMNLELLFRASALSGDEKYAEVARRHADRVRRDHVREDFSTFHLVVYDDETGDVLERRTHQGYRGDSTWARGQAWAVYGFTMCFRETGEERYLESACRLADTLLGRLPEDLVPYWDFDDPAIPDAPRDASAGAIAASALLELATLVGESHRAAYYRQTAEAMLASLSTEAYRSFSRHPAMLDRSTGSRPREREVEVPIIYADYYFIEALLRLKRIELASKKDA